MPAIETVDLTKRYGERTVVDTLNLRVPRGGVFGLLGPNGAGKTTTIAMLLGLVRPSAGRASVLGHDIATAPTLALRGVGAMIEAPAFYPYLSARDNLRVLAYADNLSAARVDAALATVDLAGRARDRFRTFSQGMKQRLAIAAALLHEPELVILDEPTNGLDPAGQHEIRELVRSLASQGRTIVFCSHILSDVEQLCQELAILRAGKLVACGAVATLLNQDGRIRVTVAGELAAAAAILQAMPGVESVTIEHDSLLVQASVEQAPAINAALVGAGIAVQAIGTQRHSLEELFLELTQ